MHAASTSLVLQLVWFVLAFGVRAAIQVRRTGDAGFRLGAERVGSPLWFARLGFVVALVIGVAAPVVALREWGGAAAPIHALDRGAVVAVGVALAAVGMVLTFVAQLAMGDAWRVGVDPDERTGLVAQGVFRIVRNPIFSTMLVTSVGLALVVPSAVSFVGLALLVVALELQVRVVEEPYLVRLHGEDYARYAAEVGRFVPAVGRRR